MFNKVPMDPWMWDERSCKFTIVLRENYVQFYCNINIFCVFYQSTGDEALQFLQKLCPNDMDVPIGGVVHTAMLNENGCYENDSSIARLGENR